MSRSTRLSDERGMIVLVPLIVITVLVLVLVVGVAEFAVESLVDAAFALLQGCCVFDVARARIGTARNGIEA